MNSALPSSFYLDQDTLTISKALIGKVLWTKVDGQVVTGLINETEAYLGISDRASHAFGGRRTKRTEVMYQEGGIAYVYLCYGIHDLFNVVVQKKDIPHAVLIRSIIPLEGIETMMSRCSKDSIKGLCNGPGKLCKAMAISGRLNYSSLGSRELKLLDSSISVPDADIVTGPRIGVGYAAEDALLPYRFLWTPNP